MLYPQSDALCTLIFLFIYFFLHDQQSKYKYVYFILIEILEYILEAKNTEFSVFP